MSNGITKVMKYELTYLDGCGDFHNMQDEVWKLQRQVREILNKTIQMAYEWDYRNYEHYQQTGAYLNTRDETGYATYDGYMYHILTPQYPSMATNNLIDAIQKAWKKYKSDKSDIGKGLKSIPSFKSNHPILVNPKGVKINKVENQWIITLTLFSGEYKKANPNISKNNVRFSVHVDDKTQRTIIERINSGEYKLGQCQLNYEKKKWSISLNYSFQSVAHDIDPD